MRPSTVIGSSNRRFQSLLVAIRELRRFGKAVILTGHLGRCHLKGREGDAANVTLTAVGHNLRRVLAWLRALLRPILLALWQAFAAIPAVRWAS